MVTNHGTLKIRRRVFSQRAITINGYFYISTMCRDFRICNLTLDLSTSCMYIFLPKGIDSYILSLYLFDRLKIQRRPSSYAHAYYKCETKTTLRKTITFPYSRFCEDNLENLRKKTFKFNCIFWRKMVSTGLFIRLQLTIKF